jgi:hypothetical protein
MGIGGRISGVYSSLEVGVLFLDRDAGGESDIQMTQCPQQPQIGHLFRLPARGWKIKTATEL